MVLKAFGTYFSDLSTPKDNPLFDNQHKIEIEEKLKALKANSSLSQLDILDKEVTEYELTCVISKLKELKAPGWDLIQNEHLIYGGKIVKTVLCRLYNSVMKLEVIPDSWKRGIIVPIYKGHNKSKSALESYRPVTLLSVIRYLKSLKKFYIIE